MNKIPLLIFCATIVAICAENPSLNPKNVDKIKKQCAEEHQLSSDFGNNSTYDQMADNTKVHAAYLCAGKAFNFYSEDEGINVDRMIYFMFQISTKCIKRKAETCVETYKELASAGEMLFKVHYCILEMFKVPETEN